MPIYVFYSKGLEVQIIDAEAYSRPFRVSPAKLNPIHYYYTFYKVAPFHKSNKDLECKRCPNCTNL